MTEQFPRPEDLDILSKPAPFLAETQKKLLEQAASGTWNPPDSKDVNVIKAQRADRKATTDATYGTSPPTVQESTQVIKLRDGFESEVRIYKPTQPPSAGSPLFVLYYGGGFVNGENRQLGPYARGLTALYGATVVNASYRLAPEHPFPVGHNDSWDTFLWATKNATELGADTTAGLVVGGVSAGGNIASVIAQQALEQNIRPAITGVWLCIPIIFPSIEQVPAEYKPFYKSMDQNAVTPTLTRVAMAGIEHHLQADDSSPWYSAANAAKPFQGWPRTYIEVAGLDPLRDDGIIVDKILRKNGATTKLVAWPGVPHGHFAFMPDAAESKAARVDTIKGFAWLLEREAPSGEVIAQVIRPPRSG